MPTAQQEEQIAAMIQALYSAGQSGASGEAITVDFLPSANGDLSIVPSDAVFQAWKNAGNEADVHADVDVDADANVNVNVHVDVEDDIPPNAEDATEAPVLCTECGFSPCIWDQNADDIAALTESLEESNSTNNVIRFEVYQFMMNQIHGYLGKGVRRPLPKCVINEVRDSWPRHEGEEYTGFRDTNNNGA